MKKKRQQMILSLIEKYEIDTQEELADRLKAEGFEVTQATVSRDIKELRLSKVAGSNGKVKYIQAPTGDSILSEKYIRVLKEGMVSQDAAGNLLVIHTVVGMAMAVATALDNLKLKEVLGCIAGDDTIFCAIRNGSDAEEVKEKINSIL
ncbi:MAG: arginine repressor [Lachnospiraceae bacterium]|nr:arginine repressor [Lachnospiraceae bacterium]MCR5777996.1 arginine repressor [Lachnospiraceae bacterium]